MKLKTSFKCLLVCYLVYISSACSHQQVPVQTIFSSNDCALREQVIKSIHTPAELTEIIQSKPVNFSQTPQVLPEVDFDKQSLVLYALGQKPTAGYSIELYRDEASIKEQTLYLPVRVKSPEAGSVQAQVITSPCQIYSLPLTDYAAIVVENNVAD